MIKKIFILGILLVVAIIITNKDKKTEAPIVTEKTANEKITTAFEDFSMFANTKPTVAAETLCQGGFINPTRPELKKVANTIIKNRIDAKNQDEAGITCLSVAHNWVLFSALNDNEYYCIDSTGVSGKFGINRSDVTCAK